ncbi:unnamed protein product [Timema podura]|uniref:Uncharacterized protein n=1 Tax=Timema podura TaxID=61482 RepID=A0ABN7NFE5_TIMPD|nr:unnamed protein product [Timema podura]
MPKPTKQVFTPSYAENTKINGNVETRRSKINPTFFKRIPNEEEREPEDYDGEENDLVGDYQVEDPPGQHPDNPEGPLGQYPEDYSEQYPNHPEDPPGQLKKAQVFAAAIGDNENHPNNVDFVRRFINQDPAVDNGVIQNAPGGHTPVRFSSQVCRLKGSVQKT